jgi:glucose/galactose transporter
MGICNKIAGVMAPLILGAVVLSDADSLVAKLQVMTVSEKAVQLNELASRVIAPYAIMSGILVVLAILVSFSPLPEIEAEEEDESTVSANEKNYIFQYPNLVLGVISLFLYVGVEVMAGDTIGIYGKSLGIPLSETKNFTAFTLISMIVGYVIGIATMPRYISQAKALAISAITGVLFSVLSIFSHGYISVLFIALLGLSNALMWPAIWPLAIHGLGRFTKTGSALLIMAIAGGALLPLLYGRLSDIKAIGNQQAYWILVPCYLFILFYSTKGYALKKWR